MSSYYEIIIIIPVKKIFKLFRVHFDAQQNHSFIIGLLNRRIKKNYKY